MTDDRDEALRSEGRHQAAAIACWIVGILLLLQPGWAPLLGLVVIAAGIVVMAWRDRVR